MQSFPRGWLKNPWTRMLPDHYLRHRLELMRTPSTRVHDDPNPGTLLDYKITDPDTLRIERVADVPIRPDPLEAANQGLFAGEGLVKGFKLPRKKLHERAGHRVPDIWVPNIFRATFYSEVLDKYLSIIVTEHALKMIDELYGIDHYILRTPIQDLQSDLALQLRRKMLIALATKSFHPSDPEKARIVYDSYKDCEIPLQEAEWIGLSWSQAIEKQQKLNFQSYEDQPMKIRLAKELLERLDELKVKGQLSEATPSPPPTLWNRIKGKFLS
ncbi:mitochondrial ribosomal protein L28 [Brevipalpus obovatus]|uniref:mitochondrial ribosomal protein L28 n=1 Tax=Brevipalpus obovatus TaxID=246614 RepID=UPI003D9E15D9